ncbi:Rrp15p-domain-containing protein [Ampelomyces quisqualis]|uniref:Rrp15p-domain-containing protein n=1 Tax=Ampelomyces quisqualis TaxID=50730 RepID=A0A6A5QVX3_AMPQU|nr:Rrp15p-domain-containing protein [Ampelomyces quisqualis]
MVNTSLKRRRTEDQLRGKVPKKEKKKVKKQKFYHSSSEDEGGARDAPLDYKRAVEESDDEPFEPTGANATLPKPKDAPKSAKKAAQSAPKDVAKPASMDSSSAPVKATPKHSLKLPVKSVLKKTAPLKELEAGDEVDDSPGDDEEDESELEADEFDVEDSESDASDGSETSTVAARKVRKRNDPEAFATSMSKILNTKLTTSKRSEPILSRSKDAQTANKEIADSKLSEKARRQIVAERKAAQDKGRVKDVLGLNDASISTAETTAAEKALRRTAQKGVIKLFNAVRAAQVKGELAEKESKAQNIVGMDQREEKVKEMSKQGFLDMITGGGRKEGSAIERLAHDDLTAQATRLGQAKGQIQHVVFVVVGLLHFVVVGVVGDNDVARGAGAGAAACALHFEVVGLGDVEQIGAVGDGEGVGLQVFVDEGDCASAGEVSRAVGGGRGNQAAAASSGPRLSKPSLGSQARDMLSDLDYDAYFPDTSPTVAGHAKRLLDQALWNYTSVLLAQPFEAAKTLLQIHEAGGQLPSPSTLKAHEWGSRSRPDSFHSGKYEDVRVPLSFGRGERPRLARVLHLDRAQTRTARLLARCCAVAVARPTLSPAPQPLTGTNVTFIYNFLLKTTESWFRSAISAVLNVPDPGLVASASGIGGLDIIDSPNPIMSLGVAVAATAIAATILAPLDLIRTRLIVTPISSSPRSIYPCLSLLPSWSVSPRLFPATLLHACIPTLMSSSTPLLLRSTLSIDPILTPTTYSLGTFFSAAAELFVRLPLETVLRRGQVAVLRDHENERSNAAYRAPPSLSRQKNPAYDSDDQSFKTIVEPGPYRGVLGSMWFIAREEGISVSTPDAAKAASAKAMGFERPSRMRKGQGLHGLCRGWRVGVWGLVGIWGAAAMGGGGGEF